VAPGGRPEAVNVTVFEPSVALTMNRTVEPAITVCAPGIDNAGGEMTVRSSHAAVAPTLFKSPEYIASQLKLPAELNFCEAEFGTIPVVTITGAPTIVGVPEQVGPTKYS